MIGATGSMPIQGLFSLTRKVSHTINRPLSKALETYSSVSIASLNALPAYLVATTTYFNERDRRAAPCQIDNSKWERYVLITEGSGGLMKYT